MVCDGPIGREAVGTAESIEELGSTKRFDEKSNIEFTFGIVAPHGV